MNLQKEKEKEIVCKLLELLDDKKQHKIEEIVNFLSISKENTIKLLDWCCKYGLVLLDPASGEYSLSDTGATVDVDSLDLYDLDILKEEIQLLQDPLLLYKIKQILDKEIVGEDRGKLILFLLLLTKDLGSENAQAVYLTGASSSGKGYIIHKILDYFPQDKVIWRTRLSTHALEYLGNGRDLNGCILYVEEAVGSEQAQASMRPLFSERGLSISIVEATKNGLAERKIQVNGCPVFITTSVVPVLEEQMSTRVWILQSDETEEQTKAILEYQKQQDRFPKDSNQQLNNIKIKNVMQLLIKPDEILIPFLDCLEFPTKKVRARRDFQKFKTLIKISAYLHQYQRPWITANGKKYLIASFADYFIAYQLTKDLLRPIMYGLPENVLNLYQTCKELQASHNALTTKLVTENCGKDYSQNTIYTYMERLIGAKLLTKEKSGRENLYYIVDAEEDSLLIPINELVLRFTSSDLEEWFSQAFGSESTINYEDILSNIYDPITGEPYTDTKELKSDKIQDNSLVSFNKESNSLLRENKEYSSNSQRFIKDRGENNTSN